MPDTKPVIIWSADANADLAEIWNYYSSIAGPDTADNIVRRIAKSCVVLEEHPYAGRARDEIRPGLRSVIASPHVVFYRVRSNRVEIVRVLDGRRDLDEIFAPDRG
jgi:toxin ParE1/3/4